MLSFAPWIYAFEVSNVGAAPTERRLGPWLFGPLSLESSLRIALSDAEVHMVRTYLVLCADTWVLHWLTLHLYNC